MGISKSGCLVLIMFTIFLASSQLMEAARIMKGEKWMLEKEDQDSSLFVLPVQILQRGPVPPSGRNPCTTIPGQGNGRCTLQTMNVAGSRFVQSPPPATPDDFALAASAAQSS